MKPIQHISVVIQNGNRYDFEVEGGVDETQLVDDIRSFLWGYMRERGHRFLAGHVKVGDRVRYTEAYIKGEAALFEDGSASALRACRGTVVEVYPRAEGQVSATAYLNWTEGPRGFTPMCYLEVVQ